MNDEITYQREVPEITPEQLRQMLETGRPVVVVDVRPLAERLEWEIPGSFHADVYADLRNGHLDVLDCLSFPSKHPIVVVCGSGYISRIGTKVLCERGYTAFSLTGGMKAWSLAWNTALLKTARRTEIVQVRRTGKGCLSYVFGADGKAAVIDASLAPEVYERIAIGRNWQICHILDTHIHADHLSRGRLLANLFGACLHLPIQERVHFPFSPLKEGDELLVGTASLKVLQTPGHTRESTSYLLDEAVVFTGDTLFLDGVGRPDLEADTEEARVQARLLYRSLAKLLALPEQVIVLPGHSSRPIPFDDVPLAATLADVYRRVELLQVGEEAFVSTILRRLPPTPPNYSTIITANESGELPVDDVTDLEAGANRCAVS